MARRRSRQAQPPTDLHDYLQAPLVVQSERPPAPVSPPITVTDDWPEFVPVTDQETRIITAFFADLLDELFGPIP
ncbi:hypothetical protein [Caulobacter sp. 602-1]|uniref:hypothetical protein n=1 Tax=Caulobacter sp. 602-1 TaxID=2492472 RepID=UPI000F64099D|nr:hypothetical protein [Caulobacter sp. 602-1]RRN64681.1 hypothetical protein EIK80_11640 [Caulobacter sp. 602-1]